MSGGNDRRRKVVITGMGIVSPIGIGTEAFWKSIEEGRSGIGRLERLPASAAPGNVGAEVKEFTEAEARKKYLKPLRKSVKVMCREIQLGVASAVIALESCEGAFDDLDRKRIGIEFGANQMFSPVVTLTEACRACIDPETGDFTYERWGSEGMSRLEPLWLLKHLPNMPACHISIFADAQGPSNSIVQADASANLALAEAVRVIERNAADVMLAGAAGSWVHEVRCVHSRLWGELAEGNPEEPPERWCRPFDKNRNGTVVGEAACTFILEEQSHAEARGATIYGTVLGGGSSCVRDSQGRPNLRAALVNAMRQALEEAQISPSEVGHINANAPGMKDTDREEALAIRDVFGEKADEVPVTSFKSYIGSSCAGCGAIELAASLLGLKNGVVPPTLNYETPDPECPLNVVAGSPQPARNNVVLNLNVTRMGQASALVVG